MAEVRLENVCKSFGDVKAVDNISLHVKDGEFIVLLGPSGCGKTTTLRCVAGLEHVDEGKIFIDERDVTDLPPAQRGLSMVFQSYAVFPHMTVFDNIAFGLKLRKASPDQIKERVKEVASLVQIEDLIDRYPYQLSGGQRQRVALARALAVEPKVLLLDEPLSNLDAALRLQMRAELKLLQKKSKVTTLYVTHDQVEAMSMGDRIAIIRNGSLEQVDTPERVFNHPENVFVGNFIGSPPMNMLECDVVEGGSIAIGNFTYKLPESVVKAIRKTKTSRVILGIRPKNITITKERRKNAFMAKIGVIEPIGEELVVNLTVDGKLLRVIASPSQDLRMGEKVWLTLDSRKIHIFDKKTGKNLL